MKKAEVIKQSVNILTKLYGTDPEAAHGIADDLLCELLKAEGYEEVVKAYIDVPKWYA